MTRSQNVKKNLIFNVVKYVATLLLQFILRTVLIYYMGAEYLGLNGLFSNIFGFLNLAELGIGSAIVFSMYKPIAENDIEKIKALQNLYKKFYLIISLVVGIIGLILTPFIPFFMNGGVEANINIYILYIMYLCYTLVGYWSAHKRSLLFAYQRNDVENKIKTICMLFMTILQIVVLVLFRNYYVYFSISILFAVIECSTIHISANKLFPRINGKSIPLDDKTKKEIKKNITALSMHKIGSAVVFSTDNILISTFFGLTVLGVYSNYSLIITTIITFFSLIANAIQASVGDLIATTDVEYVYERYKKVRFIFAYLSALTTICLATLFQPFILKWTGDSAYLLAISSVMLSCGSYYINRMRTPVWIFKDSAGLFWQGRWSPIVESIVNLGVSISCAFLCGINGIFIGTIVSTLVAPFWVEPCVLYKHYFKKSPKKYFLKCLMDFLIMVICGVVCYFVCSLIPSSDWLLLAIKFVVCFVLANALLILAYLPTGEVLDCIKFIKNSFFNK